MAKSVAVVPNNVAPIQAINGIDGDIVIIAARNDEVAADGIETGTGDGVESARLEAQEHMALMNDSTQVQVQPQTDSSGQPMNAHDRDFLHLRVPPGANLPDVRTRTGNIGIYGAVGDVTAIISTSGNIEVMGGSGNVNLQTEHGSLRIDLMPGMPSKRITARANAGNIDIIASNVVISAVTTEGYVRFIGTLLDGEPHTFATTAGGNVTIALPAYPAGAFQAYRVYASTSGSPIVTDFPANQRDGSNPAPLAICGVIHSLGPYDYHIESTRFRFGRLEVSPAPTTTYYFTGTLTPTFYRFDTDQPRISLFAPRSQAIHIYTAADLAEIRAGRVPVDADCEQALTTDLDQLPSVVLNLRSGNGRIFLHHIDLKQ